MEKGVQIESGVRNKNLEREEEKRKGGGEKKGGETKERKKRKRGKHDERDIIIKNVIQTVISSQ